MPKQIWFFVPNLWTPERNECLHTDHIYTRIMAKTFNGPPGADPQARLSRAPFASFLPTIILPPSSVATSTQRSRQKRGDIVRPEIRQTDQPQSALFCGRFTTAPPSLLNLRPVTLSLLTDTRLAFLPYAYRIKYVCAHPSLANDGTSTTWGRKASACLHIAPRASPCRWCCRQSTCTEGPLG